MITLNSDVLSSKRLCFIGMDNYRAGQTAASLTHLLLPTGGKVFTLTGHLNNTAHNQRLTGFTDTLAKEKADNIAILPFQACFDRDDFAYEITQHILTAPRFIMRLCRRERTIRRMRRGTRSWHDGKSPNYRI